MATVFIQRYNGKRGTSYFVQYKDPMTLKSKHFKTCRKYRDAKSEASKLRILLDSGKTPEDQKERRLRYLTFAEITASLKKAWSDRFAENDLSKDTYDGYVLRLKILNRNFGSRLLSDISEKEVRDFRLKQFNEQSAATSNRNLFILKQIFKHGLKLKAISRDVTKDIKYLNEDDHERKTFLMPDELQALIEASKSTRAKFYMPALIYLGAEHGTSKQEVLDLRWKDINFDYQGAGLIRLFRTKNKVERTEHLMSKSRQYLIEWRDHLKWMRKRKRIDPITKEVVFCRLNGTPIKNFRSAWRTLCNKAGFENLHYHDLRHTFCSNLILSGSDLKDVKEMIGHKDLSTTDRYSHLTSLHKKAAQSRLSEHYAQ